MLTPNDVHQRRLVTIEQIEAEYLAEGAEELAKLELRLNRKRNRSRKTIRRQEEARAEQLRRPFGASERWEASKAQMLPGDELWEYCSPRSSWEALMGMAGYELIRDGEFVAGYLLAMN